jgi:hypothetical protein
LIAGEQPKHLEPMRGASEITMDEAWGLLGRKRGQDVEWIR